MHVSYKLVRNHSTNKKTMMSMKAVFIGAISISGLLRMEAMKLDQINVQITPPQTKSTIAANKILSLFQMKAFLKRQNK